MQWWSFSPIRNSGCRHSVSRFSPLAGWIRTLLLPKLRRSATTYWKPTTWTFTRSKIHRPIRDLVSDRHLFAGRRNHFLLSYFYQQQQQQQQAQWQYYKQQETLASTHQQHEEQTSQMDIDAVNLVFLASRWSNFLFVQRKQMNPMRRKKNRRISLIPRRVKTKMSRSAPLSCPATRMTPLMATPSIHQIWSKTMQSCSKCQPRWPRVLFLSKTQY